MKKSFTSIVLIFFISSVSTIIYAQAINTDGATAYWNITDALRRNEPLNDQVWQEFLRIPTNQVYVRECFTGPADIARYRRIMEEVYRPGYDSIVQAKIKAKSWYYILLTDYKKNEAEYKKFLFETVKAPVFLESMYTNAYEYLPTRDRRRIPNLKLSYVAIGDDATSQKEGIIFSVQNARQYALFRPGLIEAHELHHQLRSQRDFGVIASIDTGLIWSLTSAQDEGLADLTDKRVLLEQSADSANVRSWLLDPAPAAIQKIDSTIQILAAGGPATSERFYRQITQRTNGHMPGFFMARTIIQGGYQQAMLDHADDPIAFALLYQRAASKKQSQSPTFSAVSIKYLQKLSRRYKYSRSVSSLSAP